jgi:serine/threonine-protein phosphatase PP1 catalytic subunit
MTRLPLERLLNLLFPGTIERKPFIKLDPTDLSWLCTESVRVLKSDPIVIPIEAPVNVVGDIHGQYFDLLELFRRDGIPPGTSYLFLGDYVDRGNNSIETFALLLSLKVKYPRNVWLLRGNHETEDVSRLYGFRYECTERYNETLWINFTNVFKYLPLAAVISERIFCVHGGLSPQLKKVADIEKIKRPVAIGGTGILTDLVWSDPGDHRGYIESERGVSFTFGRDIVENFLRQHDFDLLCRGHQVVPAGYEFPFASKNVLTIFSAPDYCDDSGNDGAMLKVDENLKCKFVVLPSKIRGRPMKGRPPTPGPPRGGARGGY